MTKYNEFIKLSTNGDTPANYIMNYDTALKDYIRNSIL
jgi:hypothetical protein